MRPWKQDSALSAPAVHIPVTAGAVVLSYNLPEVKGALLLTPSVLADIFLGKITTWNDSRLTAQNIRFDKRPDKRSGLFFTLGR
jgi:phosphate transport system substrate-binding protein